MSVLMLGFDAEDKGKAVSDFCPRLACSGRAQIHINIVNPSADQRHTIRIWRSKERTDLRAQGF